MSEKSEVYDELVLAARGLFAGERDAIANGANLAALIMYGLSDLNWAGFYFLKDGELVLGPFQGKPACIRIPLTKGVCAKAVLGAKTVIVSSVHAFAGHIACDPDSNAELAVPLLKNGNAIGVLDLDSPSLGRFDAEDAAGIEKLARCWLEASAVETICGVSP